MVGDVQEFAGGLVVGIPHCHCWGLGFSLWLGTRILQAAKHGKKKKIYD